MTRKLSPENTVPLVEVSRSGLVESLHGGVIAVVNGEGEVLAHAGSPDVSIFWRSAAKLHQALALVLEGGVKRWGLSDGQLAAICSSHNGEPGQVSCVGSVLKRIGLDESALHCGKMPPHSAWAAADMIRRNEPPSALHHMCSGNHAGLLALTRLLGADPAWYETEAAPAQKRALEVAALFAGLPVPQIELGVDGCGIPAYRTPLRSLATAFARLVAPPREWEAHVHAAARTVVNAVTRNPDIISGAGEIDAECLRAFRGQAICKLGAEGVCAAAFSPDERFPRGVGIALKIADGLGSRAIPAALLACIEQLELGTEEQRAALEARVNLEVKTHRGEPVGRMRAIFELTREDVAA